MVANHPLGLVFHHTAYGRMIEASFSHMRPYYVSLSGADDSCRGGLSLFLVRSWLTGNRLVSIPWAAYGDPMVSSSEEFRLLLGQVLEFSKQVKASYIELKTRQSCDSLNAHGMIPSCYEKSHRLDLSGGASGVWRGLHYSSVRQRIMKAMREGLKIRLARSQEEIASFYRVWCIHRRMLGLPSHRPQYFQNIWRYLTPLDMVQFWIAEKNGELLGGLCNFTYKKTVFLTYIALERGIRQMGGGLLLTWRAISEALQQGYESVDFGRTPVTNTGLMAYKRHWGACEVEAPVLYYPRVTGISSYGDERRLLHRVMRRFWKIVPPKLSRIAGEFFWRHAG